jgi:hypothetical protein
MPIHDTRVEFDSIESAHDFVDVLAETVLEAVIDLDRDRKIAEAEGDKRRVDAIDLARYKLKALTCHLHKSRRIFNDLRTIRRLLLDERGTRHAQVAAV